VQLFKKIRKRLGYLDKDQVDLVYRAYLFATKAHKGQKRVAGEPYITHPVAVTCILADMHMDHQALMAALMHDVVEDTQIEQKVLEEKFGEEVAVLVDGVTKLSQIRYKTRAEAQADYFRKMVLAMSQDIRVIIVKLADRLHNMQTIEYLHPKKRRRIAQETLDIYAPIANRLGMHEFSIELEDLAFQTLYPSRYRTLKESVRKARGNRKEIISHIEALLKEGLTKSHLAGYDLSGREKHLYSIYKKMRDRHISFLDIMDVYAFRVIVDTIENCYRALGVIHSIYKPVPERFKDYIAIPKANSYQSLHTTLFGPYGVPIEIQIRTKEMNDMANNGIAAHWIYKSGEEELNKSQLRAQQWVKNLLEMQQRTGSSLEFVENVKIDLFPNEVYVFTPLGDIMELPLGATAVDFAYAVHTDIGNTCTSAKIDRQFAPLSTELANGQTVEIITSPKSRPNLSWLNFAVTGKARSGIRHFLKSRRRTESVALGKKLLDAAVASINLNLSEVPQKTMNVVLRQTHHKSTDDLYEEIGLGNRVAMFVAHQFSEAISAGNAVSAKIKRRKAEPLCIKGTEGMVVQFATCCYPIPGDAIVGLMQEGQGIMVHDEHCKQIAKIRRHPDKCIPVCWDEGVLGEFKVMISVEVLNERGALANIASAISYAEANIDDISVDVRDGQHYIVSFRIMVKDRVHLARIMRSIRGLKPVVRITRYKKN